MSKRIKIGAEAYVADEAEVGSNVIINRHAEILPGAVIGDNCLIGSGCIIGHPSKLELQAADFSATRPEVSDLIVEEPVTKIGKGSIIRSGSTIYRYVIIGDRLRTGHNVLIREHVTIGKACVVGTQTILDGYIWVGNKSMIQSQCYVTQSVRIGDGVFIAPGCIFMDNKEIVLGKGLGGIRIGDYSRIGGGTKILPRIAIGDHALIGAGSVITKSIPAKAVAYGVPAEVKRFQTEEEIEKYRDSISNWE